MYTTIIYNMLKMKKMNELKIFALVLLSLSKFETMFGMKEKENENEDEINDEYVNKNYYLIDDLGNKITLEDGNDIKFKIYKGELENTKIDNIDKMILKIKEKGEEKVLVSDIEGENVPFVYINNAINLQREQNSYFPKVFTCPKNKIKYNLDTIHCSVVKKIGEDSINDDYILVDAENNKIEKINDKNIVFKLLTRKKYLELKGNLNDPVNFLKNEKNQYILDNLQKPLLFFEEEEKDLILYVKRIKNKLYLAWVLSPVTTINFTKDNSIKVRMAKKEEILKVKEEEKDKSSKCCCGIC